MGEPARAARLALSAFGLGHVPRAPGTVASLAVAGLLLLVAPTPSALLAWAAVLGLAGAVVTVRYGAKARAPDGGGDPGWVVSDEVAGQALAALGALPCALWGVPEGPTPLALALAFVLFRVLDVLKPWPISHLERLPGGWGVLLDDLGAGALVALALPALRALGAG